jgi:MOSC domain-containing protein YiiM
VEGSVFSVSASPRHGFNKAICESITLVKGHGIEGDAHAGEFVKHRHLARWRPRMPNERQVHIIDQALFGELRCEGFDVHPGELGENVTTLAIDLMRLPLGTTLIFGSSAAVELRGLRTPCVLIDRFQKGLLKALIRKGDLPPFRAGVMGIVCSGGDVRGGDPVSVALPAQPWRALPAL